jgi:hypothetical protein
MYKAAVSTSLMRAASKHMWITLLDSSPCNKSIQQGSLARGAQVIQQYM